MVPELGKTFGKIRNLLDDKTDKIKLISMTNMDCEETNGDGRSKKIIMWMLINVSTIIFRAFIIFLIATNWGDAVTLLLRSC